MITATATLQSTISVTAQIVSKQVGSCADGTIEINGTEVTTVASGGTVDIPVNLDGVPSGSWDGDSWEVTSNPCADATVQLNGSTIGTIPSGDTDSFPVIQDGSPVGSWNGTQWVVPTCSDADVTNSDGSYTNTVASGGTLNLPDITFTDSDGSTSSVPSVQDITAKPCEGGYAPPSDWLSLPEITAGENKLAGVVAVFDIDNNYLALEATTDSGTWSIDWGDGNTQTGIASGATVEHKLDYAGATGSLTTRGYKTALVVVTADSGNFTGIDLVKAHTESTNDYTQPWLNVRLAGANISSFNIDTVLANPQFRMWEQFDWVGTNSTTTGGNFFRDITNLKSIVNIDTSNWTSVTSFINSVPLVEAPEFDTSSVTSFNSAFFRAQLDVLRISDTSSNTNPNGFASTFRECFNTFIIEITNNGIGAGTSLSGCFLFCRSLNVIPLLGDTSAVTNFQSAFQGTGAKLVPAYDLSSGTNLTNIYFDSPNISRILAFGATVTHSVDGCNLGVAAMEEYAGNLGDGTGQTFTSTNNPASGNWDTTIVTDKNWTVVD